MSRTFDDSAIEPIRARREVTRPLGGDLGLGSGGAEWVQQLLKCSFLLYRATSPRDACEAGTIADSQFKARVAFPSARACSLLPSHSSPRFDLSTSAWCE